MLFALWNDERASSTLENMLWIALFVLGVAGAATLLKTATSDMAGRMADQINATN